MKMAKFRNEMSVDEAKELEFKTCAWVGGRVGMGGG
jgi:hypothetical protein